MTRLYAVFSSHALLPSPFRGSSLSARLVDGLPLPWATWERRTPPFSRASLLPEEREAFPSRRSVDTEQAGVSQQRCWHFYRRCHASGTVGNTRGAHQECILRRVSLHHNEQPGSHNEHSHGWYFSDSPDTSRPRSATLCICCP